MLCPSELISSLLGPELTSPFTGAASEGEAAVCHTNPKQDHSSSVFVHVMACVMQAWCTGLQLDPKHSAVCRCVEPFVALHKKAPQSLDVVRQFVLATIKLNMQS